MKLNHIQWSGIAALLLTPTVLAETKIVLDSPLERQVIQRNADEWAELKVAGGVPAGTVVVEACAELASGLRGQAAGWAVVADAARIKDGRFSGGFRLETGGWYALKVRFRKSDDRHDSIHFGPRGLQAHAERWYVALSSHYQFANPVSGKAK